ncbi:MAG: BTAD domain-containing putative transcriptional regulator, partial [Chloroflexota bacterium]
MPIILAGLFWDDLPQQKAMGNLRVLLANLRKELEPYVTITRKTAAINPNALIEVDAVTLEESLTASRDEIDKHGKLSKDVAADLSQALEAFQSTLLPGFYLKDGLGFEEWLATEREWLWTRVVEALDDLATEYLQWGDYRVGIERAQQLVNLDPLREEGHQLLMQLWVADNQISAALNQYKRCQEILDQELGTAPHLYTTELYDQIRSGEWQLPKKHLKDKAVRSEPIPHNLPRPINQLIGRDSTIDQLHTHLTDETVPLLSIVGPGGIGKTTLALEIGRQLVTQRQPLFKDGIYFVPLASLNESAQIPLALANSLGFTFSE